MTPTQPTHPPPANTSADPPLADIDRSPTLLLSSLFAAHRSGDDLLERFYLRRLNLLGIYVAFGPAPLASLRERKVVRS
jgi:hypothetical protein